MSTTKNISFTWPINYKITYLVFCEQNNLSSSFPLGFIA
ncbi:protein of unknown function [Brochothrix thermosphacta]|uniref:Uncharacterized protein n=1 Tax=Brochothrix thermosphacta TaxID=2756 RepID=A0A2X0Q7D4_BROTH|nr:hypothetical protein FM106_20500 [Brachybacterium faecium]SPN72755.1 protein of unknown function [Brochothrix thermosphacta]SPN75889.1 conserved hypothetical protein [Brochothrix thermosphacta]SPP29126.1 conserved hypothetical protein [Brochothrix thermosphacta]